MKPMFTIHEGEFLVGDYINRNLKDKYEVWVPTKDEGTDLLVTHRKKNRTSGAAGKGSGVAPPLPRPVRPGPAWAAYDQPTGSGSCPRASRKSPPARAKTAIQAPATLGWLRKFSIWALAFPISNGISPMMDMAR